MIIRNDFSRSVLFAGSDTNSGSPSISRRRTSIQVARKEGQRGSGSNREIWLVHGSGFRQRGLCDGVCEGWAPCRVQVASGVTTHEFAYAVLDDISFTETLWYSFDVATNEEVIHASMIILSARPAMYASPSITDLSHLYMLMAF